jgi:MFS family permease
LPATPSPASPSGWLQGRLAPRTVLLSGLVLAAIGTITLLTITDSTGLAGFSWRLVITGVGSGLVMATASAVAVQSVPGPLAGMAGAANNAMRQLGAALGPAVLGSILAARLWAGTGYAAAVHVCAGTLAAVFAITAIAAAILLTRKAASA